MALKTQEYALRGTMTQSVFTQPSTRVRKTDRHLLCRQQKVATLLHRGTGKFFELNSTALAVWEELDLVETVDELRQMITRKFEVPHDVAVTDEVGQLLHDLTSADLIEVMKG